VDVPVQGPRHCLRLGVQDAVGAERDGELGCCRNSRGLGLVLSSHTIGVVALPRCRHFQAPWALIVPGLPVKYPGGEVSLEVSLSSLPDIDMTADTNGTVALSLPFDFSFYVTPAGASQPVQAFAVSVDANMRCVGCSVM
jgi:hypothetical protein